MESDRRATIEAAFEAAEKDANESPTPVVEASVPAEVPVEASTETPEITPEVETSSPEQTETPEATKTEAEPEPVKEFEPAPQAWKAPVKSKWASVDPEVRQEVIRREREITRTLNETTSARQLAKQFSEVAAPFAPRFQAMGIHPLAAFHNLLQADYQLANGSKHQRAQLVAKLIKDYDVDIGTLDTVLAGQTSPEALEEQRLARLLDQRLAPVQQKLQTYEQRELAAQKEAEQTLASQIQEMEADTKTYPFFEHVRDAMADLVEISARRGHTLDLKTAYNRAVAADPQLAQQQESARQIEQQKQAALRAQRAKAASSSVSGAPSGSMPRAAQATDRRATIAAAFDALGG
jgi:hypothetical protein